MRMKMLTKEQVELVVGIIFGEGCNVVEFDGPYDWSNYSKDEVVSIVMAGLQKRSKSNEL